MFGNRIGWGLSAVIWVAGGAFLLFVYHLGNAISPTTAIGAKAAQWTFHLSYDPRNVATWMSEEGNGSEAYQAAFKYREENRDPFYRYTHSKTPQQKSPDRAVVEKGIDLLIKASKFKNATLYASSPDKLITYDLDYPELEPVLAYKDVALKTAAYYMQEENPAKARAIYEALFSLGVHMYEERVVFKEWWYARDLMGVTDKDFLPAAAKDDAALINRCDQFNAQILPFYSKFVQPIQSSIVEFLRPNIPDCLAIAERGGDHMWRTEALLALGRAKYLSDGTRADVAAIDQTLNGIIANPNAKDPQVAAQIRYAAQLAQKLTVADVRKIRIMPDQD